MSSKAKKFRILYMILGLLGTGLIVATYFLPMWWVALQSHQYPKSMYPKGIRIEFKYDGVYNGCEGVREREELAMDAGADCLIEMNKINHFIGMYPIVQGVNDVDELGNHVKYPVYAGDSMPDDQIPQALKILDSIMRNAKLAFALLVLLGMLFIFVPNKKLTWAAVLTALTPFYFLFIYVYYLYWYGHHLGLHGGGAFNGIKPFMPTVFGEGRVAQFTTMSYPYIGFFVGLAGFVLMLLAINFKNKYFKAKEWETAYEYEDESDEYEEVEDEDTEVEDEDTEVEDEDTEVEDEDAEVKEQVEEDKDESGDNSDAEETSGEEK